METEPQQSTFLKIGDKVCAQTSIDHDYESFAPGRVTGIYISNFGKKSYRIKFDDKEFGHPIREESSVLKEISSLTQD